MSALPAAAQFAEATRPLAPLALRLTKLRPTGFSAEGVCPLECGEIGIDLPGLGRCTARIDRDADGRVEGRFVDRQDLRFLFLNGAPAAGAIAAFSPAAPTGTACIAE